MANLIGRDGPLANFDVNGQQIGVAADALSPDLKKQLGIPDLNFTPGVPPQDPLEQIIGNPSAYGLSIPAVDELRMGTTPKRQLELLQHGQGELERQRAREQEAALLQQRQADQEALEKDALAETLNQLTGRSAAPAVSSQASQALPANDQSAFAGIAQPSESPLDFPVQPKPDLMTQGYRQQLQGIRMAADAEVKQKKAQAEGLLNYANQMETLNKEAEAAEKIRRQREEETSNVYKASSEAASNFEYKDPFNAVQKIGAGIAVAFGAMGAAILGSENDALKIINNTIERDLEIQKRNYDKLKDKANADRTMYLDLRDRLKDERVTDNAFKVARLEQTLARTNAITAGLEDPIVRARGEQLMGQLKQEHAKAKAQLEIDLLDKQSKLTDVKKDIKESEWKAAGFARRMEQAEGVFDALSESGFNRASYSGATQSNLPAAVQSDSFKRQQQAEDNFLNAVLRKESGANITKEERDSGERQYFPRIGDSAELIQQKKANRLQALAGMQAEGMRAIDYVPSVQVKPSGTKVSSRIAELDAAIADAERVINDPNASPSKKLSAQKALPALRKSRNQ